MLIRTLRRALNVGFDRDVFSDYASTVDEANRTSLLHLAIAGTVICCTLLLVSLLPAVPIISLTPGYFVLSFTMGLVLVLCKTLLVRYPRCVRYVWYALLILTYMAGIMLGTVLQPDTSAVTMIVFVVAVPLFCIDRPLVIYGITGAMVILFILFTRTYKDPRLAGIDTVNVCVFYVCGIVSYYQTVHAKMSDIISRTLLHAKIDTDSLTGLRNRAFCEREISRHIEGGMTSGVLVMLDVDNFKQINDRFGHDAGDRALQEVTAALYRHFRVGDIIGRLGGDEFLVFLPACTFSMMIRAKIGSLIRDIGENRFQSDDGDTVTIGMSAGVACYPQNGNAFQTLYKCADLALYSAKNSGKSRYVVYSDMQEKT